MKKLLPACVLALGLALLPRPSAADVRIYGDPFWGCGFTLLHPNFGFPVYRYAGYGCPVVPAFYGIPIVATGFPCDPLWAFRRPAIVQRERFVYIERGAPPAPPAGDRPAPPDAGNALPPRPAPRTGILEAVRRQLRVEPAEGDRYLVRWTGLDAERTAVLEIAAAGAGGQTLAAKRLTEKPFRGLLELPEGTRTVQISVEYTDGASASVKLPIEQFRSLIRN